MSGTVPRERAPAVFCSHAMQDTPVVRDWFIRPPEMFRSAFDNVRFFSYYDRPASVGDYHAFLKERMREADVFIAFLSRYFATSDACREEIAWAFEENARRGGQQHRLLLGFVVLDDEGERFWDTERQPGGLLGALPSSYSFSPLHQHVFEPSSRAVVARLVQSFAEQIRVLLGAAANDNPAVAARDERPAQMQDSLPAGPAAIVLLGAPERPLDPAAAAVREELLRLVGPDRPPGLAVLEDCWDQAARRPESERALASARESDPEFIQLCDGDLAEALALEGVADFHRRRAGRVLRPGMRPTRPVRGLALWLPQDVPCEDRDGSVAATLEAARGASGAPVRWTRSGPAELAAQILRQLAPADAPGELELRLEDPGRVRLDRSLEEGFRARLQGARLTTDLWGCVDDLGEMLRAARGPVVIALHDLKYGRSEVEARRFRERISEYSEALSRLDTLPAQVALTAVVAKLRGFVRGHATVAFGLRWRYICVDEPPDLRPGEDDLDRVLEDLGLGPAAAGYAAAG